MSEDQTTRRLEDLRQTIVEYRDTQTEQDETIARQEGELQTLNNELAISYNYIRDITYSTYRHDKLQHDYDKVKYEYDQLKQTRLRI